MYEAVVHVSGVLMFGGLISILYNMLGSKVTKARRPLYFLALPMVTVMCAIYINYFVDTFFHFRVIPPGSTRIGFIAIFFLLGLLLNIVPYTDRKEQEQILRQLKESKRLKNEG